VQNGLILKPFGVGSDTNTFSLRVIGWTRILETDETNALWDPTDLCELLCTLSSTPIGIAGKIVTETNLFADTIAITGTTANAGVSIDVVSPANDRAGHVVLDIKGFSKIEIIFKTGGVATSCNALVRAL
jgi:hypothetical protein